MIRSNSERVASARGLMVHPSIKFLIGDPKDTALASKLTAVTTLFVFDDVEAVDGRDLANRVCVRRQTLRGNIFSAISLKNHGKRNANQSAG